MKESIADKTARAYRKGADDAIIVLCKELAEQRELIASQAKTIESLHAALDRFAFRTEDA